MKTLLSALVGATLLAGCAINPVTGEREIDIDRLNNATAKLGQVVHIATLVTGDRIVRSERAVEAGNLVCNALAAPDTDNTLLTTLANNGLCDLFVVASTNPD